MVDAQSAGPGLGSSESPLGVASDGLGLVMGGGGARAAYQAGFLRRLAKTFPDLRFPYITGVSAGAINAALLASHHGTFRQATEEMDQLWSNLRLKDVFRVDARSLAWNGMRWVRQLFSGGLRLGRPTVRGLVDTRPLRNYLTEVLHAVDGELTGIQYNLDRRRLRAVALSTSSYSTGQSVTWIQGQDIKEWERPHRRARKTILTVDHVMASAALPLLFPAVELEGGWYGDGGLRLPAPLAPALHLGASRILAISTHHEQSDAEADAPAVRGYPPPAQVMGVLLNSVFLDQLDTDALRLKRINRLLEHVPEGERDGLRSVDLLAVRPSVDLAVLAGGRERHLPHGFRYLTRGLGTHQINSPDLLSMILFQPDYLHELLQLGEADADALAQEIASFLRGAERLEAERA